MNLNQLYLNSYLDNLICFEKKPHIAVGVSGGPDSMCITHLLNRWIKLKKGKLSALVFDHGIRNNSKEESLQVREMLTKILKTEAIIIKPNKNTLIKKNMSSARTNRFEGLINFCNKNNISHLFLGHHIDDNLETFLIRKINGSNLEGLGSIDKIAYYKNIQILRPLIEVNKTSILKYNQKNKINYLNDPSNTDVNYTRVKVRNFLEKKNIKKTVKEDFFNLKKQIPSYKKMIWELFLTILCDVKSHKIKIRFDKFIKFDRLIIEKHILLVLKYLNKNNLTKSSKINIFIDSLKNPNFKIFNLSGVIIEKKTNSLFFSLK